MRYRGRMSPRPAKPEKENPKEKREKVSLYLPPDLAQELRIDAVKQRRKISVVAEQFIRDGLAARARVEK